MAEEHPASPRPSMPEGPPDFPRLEPPPSEGGEGSAGSPEGVTDLSFAETLRPEPDPQAPVEEATLTPIKSPPPAPEPPSYQGPRVQYVSREEQRAAADDYALLGVPRDATDREISEAVQLRARTLNQAMFLPTYEGDMDRLNAAENRLLNQDQRALYDAQLQDERDRHARLHVSDEDVVDVPEQPEPVLGEPVPDQGGGGVEAGESPSEFADTLPQSDDQPEANPVPSGGSGAEGDRDPLYDQAAALVREADRGSVSLIQRKLRVGYNRATRIMEELERGGVVGSMGQNGNRKVLAPGDIPADNALPVNPPDFDDTPRTPSGQAPQGAPRDEGVEIYANPDEFNKIAIGAHEHALQVDEQRRIAEGVQSPSSGLPGIFDEPREDIPDGESPTRRERVSALRSVIDRFGSRNVHPERSRSGINFLRARSAELDAKSALFGERFESLVSKVGESYNKLGWKWKIALGAALFTGSAISASVSSPLAAVFGIGMFAQRALGGVSMYVGLKKALEARGDQSPLNRGDKLALAALTTGVALTASLVMAEGVQLVNHSFIGDWIRDFFGQYWPGAESVPHPTGGAAADAASAPAPRVDAPPPPAPAPAPVPPSPMEQIQEIAVPADKGHGYEWMLKRAWEQLQEQHLDPGKFAEGSDIRQLLEADKDTINGVVHRIAMDPSHGFFTSDGTSVVIDQSAHMNFTPDGHIQIIDANHPHGFIEAPSDAPVTDYTPGHPHYSWEDAPIRETATDIPASSGGSVPHTAPVPQPGQATSALAYGGEGVPVEGTVPDVSVSHLYAGAPGAGEAPVVFGGSHADRLKIIAEYLSEHPRDSVLGTDPTGTYRVAWSWSGEAPVASEPMKSGGFLGLFKTFLPPPGPGEVGTIIT